MNRAEANRVWAVLPAAGSGVRMGGERPKQYRMLSGKAAIEHSLAALLALPQLQRLVVALAPNDACWETLSAAAHPRVQTVAGGAERFQSVLNGLQTLPAADDDWVLVHDAVRPCVSVADVQTLLNAVADDAVGGLLALPVADTIKRSDAGRVSATLDRSGLWQAQTPQVFRYGLLKAALQDALAAGVVVTDEAAALERLGHAPLLVAGSARNIKLTWPQDMALAAALLAAGETP